LGTGVGDLVVELT